MGRKEHCYFHGEKPAHPLPGWDEATGWSDGAFKVTASQVPQDRPGGGRAEQTVAIVQRGILRRWWSFDPIVAERREEHSSGDGQPGLGGPGFAGITSLRGSPPPGRAVATVQADGIRGGAWLMLGSQ